MFASPMRCGGAGPNYLNALRRDLGEVAQQSAIVLPTRSVATTEELDLGGRMLSLRAWPTAHTDTDLTVFDEASRTLWLGDLLFVGHVPVLDGNLRGFLAALAELKTVRANLAIPGHGRALAWPEAIAPEERYLNGLLADVRAAIKAKRTLAETLGDRRRRRRAMAVVRPVSTGATSPRPMPSSSGTNERQGVYCRHCRPASGWRAARGDGRRSR